MPSAEKHVRDQYRTYGKTLSPLPRKDRIMKWITRSHVHVDRVACPWLITRFIDSDAEFLFVPKTQVLERAERKMPSLRHPRGSTAP